MEHAVIAMGRLTAYGIESEINRSPALLAPY